jgi:two-component SAPR family response regulator
VDLAEDVEALRPGIAVVFMSANPSDALDGRRRAGKKVAFLAKPFTLSALDHAMREAVDQATSEAEEGRTSTDVD